MIYNCCVRQKKCRSILKHVLKRCDNRKSCRRPVVSLSHATKSYRVNRPLQFQKYGRRVLSKIQPKITSIATQLRVNRKAGRTRTWFTVTADKKQTFGNIHGKAGYFEVV